MAQYKIQNELVKYPPEIPGYDDMQGSSFMQVYNWCIEQFGDPSPYGAWSFYFNQWDFDNKDDCTFFILRWC